MSAPNEEEYKLYLISIKPYYAFQIFKGLKKFELRKWTGSAISENSIMIVYASGNVRAIIGEFKAGIIYEGRPEEVWRKVQSHPSPGVSSDAWPYIKGAKRAYAIEVRKPKLYPRRISLEEIRSIVPGWMPPLSYRLLKDGDPLYELIIKPLRRSLSNN